ncbi:MAG: MobA/MobL family protein [Bifidobacterium aquikefiri]|uniref:MobA/MobL family protein n=2 Tax=Bifidobacterium TaxID=1678 RepID=UPI000B9B47E2|nr:MobA/MobL family protein [Bifidobacterium aquikefiri]
MAIYSLHVGNVSRASGSSSCASLSYITAERVRDERLGVTYNGFSRRERVIESHTLLPEGAHERLRDAEALFNGVEAVERAANARTAKKIMVALPREFTPEQRREVVERFIGSQLNARGYAATYAIHEDGGGNNPHAHILIPNRQLDADGWARVKSRKEYKLDEAGQRIPLIDKATGMQKLDKRNRKQWQRVSVTTNPLDERETLQSLRTSWASECNRLLPERLHVSEKSLKARGIEAAPTIHEGYAARGMEARGGVSERMGLNRLIRRVNALIDKLREQVRGVAGELQSLLNETRRHGREPEPERRGEPERTAARDQTGARGTQELPGRADTARLQQPSEPQRAAGGDNLHDGTGQPDAAEQLAAIRGLRQQTERSLKEGHPLWLQGIRGERGANGQQERNAAQEDARRAERQQREADERAQAIERERAKTVRRPEPEIHRSRGLSR